MTEPDPAQIAEELTTGERAALLSLPAHDRGGLSEEVWWAYYAIMDAGLMASAGDFHMIATPLGEAVLDHIRRGRA